MSFCCEDFEFKYNHGYIWFEESSAKSNMSQEACFIFLMTHPRFHLKTDEGYKQIKWQTYLEYCPWCGKELKKYAKDLDYGFGFTPCTHFPYSFKDKSGKSIKWEE